MTTATKPERCGCPVCLYGKKIRDLIHRTPDAGDKALIEKLYDDLIHAEDDLEFHRTKTEGCHLKHGGISFTDAIHAIESDRQKTKGSGK